MRPVPGGRAGRLPESGPASGENGQCIDHEGEAITLVSGDLATQELEGSALTQRLRVGRRLSRSIQQPSLGDGLAGLSGEEHLRTRRRRQCDVDDKRWTVSDRCCEREGFVPTTGRRPPGGKAVAGVLHTTIAMWPRSAAISAK